MQRSWWFMALGCGIALGWQSKGWTNETISYYNHQTHKNERVTGTILKETAQTITYRVQAGKTAEIPAEDVLDVTYQPKEIPALEYRQPFNMLERSLHIENAAQRKKILVSALVGLENLLPKLNQEEFPQRNVRFKIAEIRVRLAEEDKSEIGDAIADLIKFKTQHSHSWQLIRCVKLLGQMQEKQGDELAAQATYEEMANHPTISPKVRRLFSILIVRYLLRSGKHALAENKLRSLEAKTPANSPDAVRIRVYQAACATAAGRQASVEKDLQAVLHSNASNELKGLAANTLADSYRLQGNREKAFWQYLWVDVVYNEDREEHAKALYHLAILFKTFKADVVRADECHQRLLQEFPGMEYQLLALKETRK